MTYKPVFLIQCPIASKSGYGERSRDLARAVIALDTFDVKLLSTRWGSTPLTALEDGRDNDLISRVLLQPLTQQPEVFMQITVPNEFNPIGKFNIGVTAGIETDLCDASWLEGMNRMQLNLVSSEHAKEVFEKTVYDKRDNNTNQTIEQLKLTSPIEVLFEGVKLDVFQKAYMKSSEIETIFSSIPETFCFLFVGHWLQGDLGEDRKNVATLIKTFLEAFKNKSKKPALILKTSVRGVSQIDKFELLKRIQTIKDTVDSKNLPNIYIVHGDLTDAEMSDLYMHPKVKVHISLTKGEGFGRPLLEAAVSGKPIITTGWSGHLDFLDKDTSILLDGDLLNVHHSAVWQGVINPDAKWFNVKTDQVVAYMQHIYEAANYKLYLEKSRKTYHKVKTKFSWELMKDALGKILDSTLPDFPKPVQFKLPPMKKIQLPTLTKLKNEN
jgi:glycosyltransferase involved in cell wall biosynthesis